MDTSDYSDSDYGEAGHRIISLSPGQGWEKQDGGKAFLTMVSGVFKPGSSGVAKAVVQIGEEKEFTLCHLFRPAPTQKFALPLPRESCFIVNTGDVPVTVFIVTE